MGKSSTIIRTQGLRYAIGSDPRQIVPIMLIPAIDTLVSGFKSDQAIDVTFIVTYETGRWLVCGSSTGV